MALSNLLADMVVEESLDDFDKPRFTVAHRKISSKFIVSKILGDYQFYRITKTEGTVPESLAGKYSGPDAALKAISNYLVTAKYTQAAKNRDTRKRIEAKKNGSKPNTNGKDDIQQRSPN